MHLSYQISTARPEQSVAATSRLTVRASGNNLNASNVIAVPQTQPKLVQSQTSKLSRKEQLESEMRRLLAKDDSWYQGPAPSNVVHVTSSEHFRQVIQRADSIVMVDFFAPNCYACRSMWPKMKQIASSNPDVTFAMVNTSVEQLGSLANNLGVAKLPWFIIFDGGSGEQRASFTANLGTINVIRAEIAAAKECTAPQCFAD